MPPFSLFNGFMYATNSVHPKDGPNTFRLQKIAFDGSKHGKNICSVKLKRNAPASLLYSPFSIIDHKAFVKPPTQSPSFI
jgi:hypothetical protein